MSVLALATGVSFPLPLILSRVILFCNSGDVTNSRLRVVVAALELHPSTILIVHDRSVLRRSVCADGGTVHAFDDVHVVVNTLSRDNFCRRLDEPPRSSLCQYNH